MRNVIYFLSALLLAVVAAFFLREMLVEQKDPGYVLIGYGHWSIETSLFVFGVILLVVFIALYISIRLVTNMVTLPKKIKQKTGKIKDIRSQQALIAGLIDSAEGNWEKAEKALIKHATDSGTPLLHYLTAARAAQSRGALEKRDQYLRMAYESDPQAEIAVGLTQAELHLSHKQFDQALESLTRLKSIAPTHATVLKLLHQTYEHLSDWEAIQKLLPALHKNKVLIEAEVKLLETETVCELIKKKAETGDPAALRAFWESVPRHIQEMSGVQPLYLAAMIESGAGSEIEQDLCAALAREWSETLLVLYGCINSDDSFAQMTTAETWLKEHPHDAVLLRVLGKLGLKSGDRERAERYLTASVGIEPSVEAYQLLGDLFIAGGDAGKASECYKRGLQLASSEVVKQVEDMSSDYLEEVSAAASPS
ncbi:MAG: heme biosynthesis HemY N-terminal domain-containing protein [Pseudomonadota bacterium]